MTSPIVMGEVGPPWFDQMPVAIIGGGRSTCGFDFNRLRGLAHVIAVKAAIFEFPWADCGAGIDFPRLISWLGKFDSVTMPVYWAVSPHLWAEAVKAGRKKPACMTFLEKSDGFRISDDPKKLYAGGTSGYGAIGLACLKRAKRFPIFLFGFDYHAPAGGYHRTEEHYKIKRLQEPTYWMNWARSYNMAAKVIADLGVKVINASPESKITCFEKVTIEGAVEHLARLGRERSRSLCGDAQQHQSSPHVADPNSGPRAERLDSARLLPEINL